ncbi:MULTISPECIES: phage holin family protein [Leuconostoc]|uniref:Arginine/ornithine antiporter ArcD n=2 Tax=Leuconostoc TaxID=1243 RepID=A0AAN2QW39_9LACO|nr:MULTISPECIES: phage holin family protein [Leuconostoc]AFS40075.1 integral membrane protein [Leuconostoc gelidum JB7]MBZ5943487.1 phage holin family protein [Leuconostoc gasicomitatum]MBZ5946392.1 phage holin family protein [Leuconostoc gasicomitatum]MBZ5948471.1 phage holin family protein [Leuconostoc gasicomitatum]MBZ5952715.1 phage holin family protein [Leuconostoc gasicomitatum]
MRFFARLATTMLVFLVISSLFSEAFRVDNWMTALGAALVLAVLNTIIKPILTILTLPLTFITFGLFTIVINGIMLEITADLVGGFDFSSFGWAMFTAIILSIVNTLLTSDLHVHVERK